MDSKRHHDAVLFDLDGTLINTTPLILASFRHVEREHGGKPRAEQEWLSGLGTALRSQLREYAADEAETDRMLETYRLFNRAYHDRLARAFPGVAELLGELQRRRYKLAVVTSKSREMAQRGLKLFDLQEFFEGIVALEDTPSHKPEPAPLLLGAERLEVAAARALYVGDAPADAAAARAAGMAFAAALWGGLAILQELDGAVARLQQPAELLELLP
jgi:pyrophosphatase PpaX